MNATISQKSLDQVLAAIAALDLDPIKVKLMHEESGEGWSRGYADRMETEYRRFLELMVKYPDEAIAPSMDVDEFWHYHILDTMKYAEDCQNVFGYFLHHFPYLGLRGEDDLSLHEAAGENMHRLYEKEYGAQQPVEAGARDETAWSAASGRTAWSAASARTAWSAANARPAWSAASARPAWSAASARTAWSAANARTAWSAASARTTQSADSTHTAWSAASARPAWSAASARTAWSAASARTAWSAANARTAWSAANSRTAAWSAANSRTAWSAASGRQSAPEGAEAGSTSVNAIDMSRRPSLAAA